MDSTINYKDVVERAIITHVTVGRNNVSVVKHYESVGDYSCHWMSLDKQIDRV
jgi:hypothetical protein